jgi:hypothetical protein
VDLLKRKKRLNFREKQNIFLSGKRNYMKKYLHVLLIAIILTPSIALASWWNPISWFVNNQPDQTSVIVSSTSSNFETQKTTTVFSWWNPTSWFRKNNVGSGEPQDAHMEQDSIVTTVGDTADVDDLADEEVVAPIKPSRLLDGVKINVPKSKVSGKLDVFHITQDTTEVSKPDNVSEQTNETGASRNLTEQETIKIGKDISTRLEGMKNELEKLYSIAEVNRRYVVADEVRRLEQRIGKLEQIDSTIQSCAASTASDIADTNSTYNTRIAEQNRINELAIARVKAYFPVGSAEYTDSVANYEKEAADKISQIENDRRIALQNIKVACDTSPLTMLKSNLVTLISSTMQQKEEISRYVEKYSDFQKIISDDIGSLSSYQKYAENGKLTEANNVLSTYPDRIVSIASRLNTIDATLRSDVTSGDSSYKLLLDAGWRASDTVSGTSALLKTVTSEAKTNVEAWRQANTPVNCRSTSEYVSNGKTNTSMTCDGTGGVSILSNNPIFCHSSSQWSSGKLITTMSCGAN